VKRLLILPAVAALCVVEVYRRGFIAPLAYGCRRWVAACRPEPDPHSEADWPC